MGRTAATLVITKIGESIHIFPIAPSGIRCKAHTHIHTAVVELAGPAAILPVLQRTVEWSGRWAAMPIITTITVRSTFIVEPEDVRCPIQYLLNVGRCHLELKHS